VSLVCDSLDHAYNARRQQMVRPTAESHLALAEWCLQYGLTAQAQRELEEVKRIDGRHPRLALIERRVSVVTREPVKAQAKANVPHPPTPNADSNAERAGQSADVSARVLERFTRKVQPVLVNNCTESGCHQPGGAEAFQLDRAILHGLANRRSTMNNLMETIALVDRAQPQLSPLLTIPRGPHGGMENPVFGPRQEQAYQHLVEWVTLITQSERSKEETGLTAEAPNTMLLDKKQPAPIHEASADVVENDAAAAFSSNIVESAGVAQAAYEEGVPDPESNGQRLRIGAQLERWQPRDPFDPEIFNRQYSKRRTAIVPPGTPPKQPQL
jgi:hypothetical protein